jgi:hypothetical protein
MSRIALAGGLFIAIGVTAAACSDNMPRSSAQSPGYFTDAAAPLVAPYDQNDRSDTTAQKQEKVGYFPYPEAPLVAPDEGNAGADTTAGKQSESGYFPAAGAPLVAPISGTR